MPPIWNQPHIIEWTALLLASFERLLGRPLLETTQDSSLEDASRLLFEASFVVVSHGTQDDPILCYGNRAALELWETDFETLAQLPSRKTAEPVHRDERAAMLRRTQQQGYIDDYQGIRISTSGRRFHIKRAIIWNLTDTDGIRRGQAATFSDWTFLDENQD